MKIAISDGKIYIADCGYYFDDIRATGRFHWDKRKQCMIGDLSLITLDALAACCRLPDNCATERARLRGIADAVEREKHTEDPVPLFDYPIKNATLMKHQVRGANIAMILFGVPTQGGNKQ